MREIWKRDQWDWVSGSWPREGRLRRRNLIAAWDAVARRIVEEIDDGRWGAEEEDLGC